MGGPIFQNTLMQNYGLRCDAGQHCLAVYCKAWFVSGYGEIKEMDCCRIFVTAIRFYIFLKYAGVLSCPAEEILHKDCRADETPDDTDNDAGQSRNPAPNQLGFHILRAEQPHRDDHIDTGVDIIGRPVAANQSHNPQAHRHTGRLQHGAEHPVDDLDLSRSTTADGKSTHQRADQQRGFGTSGADTGEQIGQCGEPAAQVNEVRHKLVEDACQKRGDALGHPGYEICTGLLQPYAAENREDHEQNKHDENNKVQSCVGNHGIPN